MTSAGIDCSGLVHMSFRACGHLVPRDADQQEEAGEPLSEAELRAGDLVTYGPPEEPAELRRRRRALVRLVATGDVAGER
jgi:cell wall-associated NlpC family hydrolase